MVGFPDSHVSFLGSATCARPPPSHLWFGFDDWAIPWLNFSWTELFYFITSAAVGPWHDWLNFLLTKLFIFSWLIYFYSLVLNFVLQNFVSTRFGYINKGKLDLGSHDMEWLSKAGLGAIYQQLMRNLRLLCLGMWQWENGFSVHVCWQTCFGQVHPRSLVANNLFRVAVLPSRKSHQQNCHIYPVYHKIHVCHIYLYAYFWWGSDQNMTLMWWLYMTLMWWLLVPMSQDVIPKKPFGWNRKPKPKIPRPLPLKRNPKKSKVGDILFESFPNSFTLFFLFFCFKGMEGIQHFWFQNMFQTGRTTTTTCCNQIVSFMLLFCQCCQRPPKKNRGKVYQSKRDGFFNSQGLNMPKRHGEAAHVVFQWQIFMQAISLNMHAFFS